MNFKKEILDINGVKVDALFNTDYLDIEIKDGKVVDVHATDKFIEEVNKYNMLYDNNNISTSRNKQKVI